MTNDELRKLWAERDERVKKLGGWQRRPVHETYEP